jgi:hypothetical protein
MLANTVRLTTRVSSASVGIPSRRRSRYRFCWPAFDDCLRFSSICGRYASPLVLNDADFPDADVSPRTEKAPAALSHDEGFRGRAIYCPGRPPIWNLRPPAESINTFFQGDSDCSAERRPAAGGSCHTGQGTNGSERPRGAGLRNSASDRADRQLGLRKPMRTAARVRRCLLPLRSGRRAPRCVHEGVPAPHSSRLWRTHGAAGPSAIGTRPRYQRAIVLR